METCIKEIKLLLKVLIFIGTFGIAWLLISVNSFLPEITATQLGILIGSLLTIEFGTAIWIDMCCDKIIKLHKGD